jgi:glycolate oxidase FAD binding subunit
MATTPESANTVSAAGTLAQALQLVDELSRSPLLPTAVWLTNLRSAPNTLQNWRVVVLCEGFNETVARHVTDIRTIAGRIGFEAECLRDENSTAAWQQVRDLPLRTDALIFRVTVPRLAVAQVLNTICGWSTDEFASPAMAIDTTAGVIWVEALPNRGAAAQFPKLIALAQQQRGHALMFAAPLELKQAIDVWGPSAPTLALMREIKRQFDPHGILNPDRFLHGV